MTTNNMKWLARLTFYYLLTFYTNLLNQSLTTRSIKLSLLFCIPNSFDQSNYIYDHRILHIYFSHLKNKRNKEERKRGDVVYVIYTHL